MIILHDHYLRQFVATWKRAQAAQLQLPETTDTSYASRETLLRHILRAARGYMVWMCEQLELPAPDIEPTPEEPEIEAAADAYLDHLARGWSTPLADVDPDRFEDRAYKARWGTLYTIDAMMEHAVMHPLRHDYQLKDLLGEN